MCGRVIVDYDEMMPVAADSELAKWITERPAVESSWNIKPTQQIPLALTSSKDGAKRFVTAHWSLIPRWADSVKLKYPTFNARAESVTEKATFKTSVPQQRCIIPVTGFYEWSGPASARTPHAIFGPTPILPIAGLYSWWRSPEGDWRLTATMLTQASAGVMRPLHHRMPVFVAGSLIETWLDPDTPGDQHLVDAVCEAAVGPASQLHEFPVAPLRGDGPELIAPAAPPSAD